MRILLLLVMIASYCPAITQPLRRILDMQTGLPVSYATIKVLHRPRGIIASAKGEFELLIDNTDSVLFSCVGYNQKIVVGEKIGTTIYLTPKIKELREVKIGKKRLVREILLGNKDKKLQNDFNWGPGSSGLKEEFAQKIEIPDSTFIYRVKKIYIPVKKFSCWGQLLVRIYAADSSSEFPGEEIFLKLVDIQKNDIRQRKATIDLSEENLYFHNCKSFFISIGWPQDAYYSKCITTVLLSKASQEKTYARYLGSNSYMWYPFGLFKDLNGVTFEAKTGYSVELEQLK